MEKIQPYKDLYESEKCQKRNVQIYNRVTGWSKLH